MVIFFHTHGPLIPIMMKLEVDWVTKHWGRGLFMLLAAEESLGPGTIYRHFRSSIT
jgi:hypothetical protein